MYNMDDMTAAEVTHLADMIFVENVSAGWWDGYTDGNEDERVPQCLLLIHSEISEACEAHRKGLADDKLPHRDGLEVELADAIIRILDLAGAVDYDIGTVKNQVTKNERFLLKRSSQLFRF